MVLALIVAIIARGSMAEDPLEGKNPASSMAYTPASCETSLSVEVSYLLDQDSDPEEAFCSDSGNFPLPIVLESPAKTFIGEQALAGLRPYKAGKHGTPVLCLKGGKEAVRRCISENLQVVCKHQNQPLKEACPSFGADIAMLATEKESAPSETVAADYSCEVRRVLSQDPASTL